MTPPRRRLGLSVTAAIVVANMIGTGVFTSTGFQAMSLHDPWTILLAWVIGGVLALCGAAAYAELGARMPKAGGEYVYLREAYHPAVGFMSGWVSLTAGFSAPIAVSALAFSTYLATLVPSLHSAEPWVSATLTIGHTKLATIALGAQQAVAMALIAGVTALHSFDAKIGGWVQAAFTAAKVLLIVLFILGGLLIGDGSWSNLASQAGGLDNVGTMAFATALMYVSFAYSGWNAAAYIAGEVERPERTIPRALLLGTGIVMVLYVLLNLVFLYAVPIDVLSAPVVEVGDVAAKNLFGTSAGRLVTSVIALALVSAVSAMVMAGPRVYAAMAADRALPKKLAYHNQRGVPVIAVITQGVLGCLFVLVGDLGQLIRFVGFTLAIFAALTVAAVFVLRARGRTADRDRDRRARIEIVCGAAVLIIGIVVSVVASDGSRTVFLYGQMIAGFAGVVIGVLRLTPSGGPRSAGYRTFGYPITPLLFIALSCWIAYAQIKDHPWESAVVGLVLLVGGVIYMIAAPAHVPSDADATDTPRSPQVPEARVVSKPPED